MYEKVTSQVKHEITVKLCFLVLDIQYIKQEWHIQLEYFFVREMYVLCLKLNLKLDSSFFVDLINMCFPQNDQLWHSITLMELQMTIWKFHILWYFCAYICQIIFYLVSWASTKFMQTQKSDKTCQKGQHLRHSASVKICFWWFSVILYCLISF